VTSLASFSGAYTSRRFQIVFWLVFLCWPTTSAPHTAEQRGSTRSPHGPLAVPCENCHTSAGWRPIRAVPEFDHNKTSYPLRGMHEKVQCTQCHVKPIFTDVGKNCADCHADIHRRKFGSDCAQCHTVLGWQVATQQIKDHQNRFPLFGAHAAVQCEDCHKQAAVGQFEGLSTVCSSCHLKDFQKTTNPNHAAAGGVFLQTCQTCHTFDTWLNAKFDHSSTGFLLTFGHANVPCASCHINNNYNLHVAADRCGTVGCHVTTWQQTNNPVHANAGPAFSLDNCANCHTTKGWDSASFDHSSTGFLLTNGHANVPCASCHINNNYNLQVAPTACGTSGCHLTTWQQTNNPVHPSAGPAFALANCANCHTTKGWDAASFDHSVTGFTLTGTHMSPTPTPCASCHINNNYSLNSADCYSCHMADWNKTPSLGANVPDHIKAGFPNNAAACASCHPITKWADGKFDHTAFGFPLTNGHATVPCASCHINNNYSLNVAANACGTAGCHLTTWQQTNNPVHSSAGPAFALANCANCHTTKGWDSANFDHSSTGFLLTNGHANVPCASCHINNNYNLQVAPTACGTSGCHLTTWQQTNNPVHSTAGPAFALGNCANCHTTKGWDAASFDHSVTGFTLTGTHMSPTPTPCASCHINNNYTLNSADCYTCHVKDWNTTPTLGPNVPNHITAGFPTSAAACASCHPITKWADGKFDHSTTGFTLVGTHMSPAPTPCSACHINGNYTLKSTDCYGCHVSAWNTTATIGQNVPNHITSGFPNTAAACSSCHPITTWADGKFDHSTTGFPLTNKHTTVACALCHVNGNYALQGIAPTACGTVGCHVITWQQTNNPVHSTAGPAFAMANCANCHTTAGWDAASFDHSVTGFTLVGTHMSPTPTPCASCHINNNYLLNSTDCYGCHVAAWNSTATIGSPVPNHIAAGFPNTAAQCASCHPITTWAAGKFDHSTTGFPLTGAHADPTKAPCSACHVNNNYSGNLPMDCYSCHVTAWQSTVTLGGNVPNHIASNFPTTCATCHTTTTWLGAVFDHTNFWRLPHHNAVCSDCHIDSTNYANTSCINCHTQTAHTKPDTDQRHRGNPNYKYGPMTCIAAGCHTKGP
jgi:hypothetical protein